MAVTPKIRRSYKGAPVSAVLDTSGVTSATQTAITLSTSPSTWPTGKFFVVVAPGTTQEEKMCVTVSGSTMTVVDPSVSSTSASANGRGVDDTTARSTIAGGATVYPVATARDFDEANSLTATYANQGGIVYLGDPSFTQLAIGTAGQVLKVNSGATAPEWGQVAAAGIASDAVTTAKILDANVTAAKLATDSVTTAKITDANVTAGKLATDAVTTAKIADDAVTLAKLAPAATPGLIHLNTTSVSGESSKTISNIFSSTYSSYKIVLSNFTISTNVDWTMVAQLTSSGTPGGSYAKMYVGTSELSTSVSTYVTGTGGEVEIARGNYNKPTFVELTIDNPATGTIGSQMFVNASFRDSANGWQSWSGGAVQKNNYNGDGIKIATVGGQLMTGTITVYAYLK